MKIYNEIIYKNMQAIHNTTYIASLISQIFDLIKITADGNYMITFNDILKGASLDEMTLFLLTSKYEERSERTIYIGEFNSDMEKLKDQYYKIQDEMYKKYIKKEFTELELEQIAHNKNWLNTMNEILYTILFRLSYSQQKNLYDNKENVIIIQLGICSLEE